MSERMDDARIAELRAVCDAATAGPWGHGVLPEWEPYRIASQSAFEGWTVDDDGFRVRRCVVDDGGMAEGDQAFVIAARTALPEALDALEQERARADRAEALLVEPTDKPVALAGRIRALLNEWDALDECEWDLDEFLALGLAAALAAVEAGPTREDLAEANDLRAAARCITSQSWPVDMVPWAEGLAARLERYAVSRGESPHLSGETE